ncbi:MULTISPECIES: DUF3331 domain-containing protein [Burkholderia]|uniref:DUF3331 domain-containing protein n=1 Tax=Burkholderia TaxID=32008 RepID=UPI000751B723|nr:DUF3331 domain-containing protein [Burkholderia seminalis]AOJ26435.1 hypothetical protein WJ12_15895 [Burkholderia seminalis]KVF43723.1 hypothetical protein WJ13_29960 [Burkholderia seminalis]MCA8038440.1 DUF3331 domain-containing protein [Burkholderia seminalis]MDN7850424.1 DUF3331 domain-containing protein [Burkholderia seminalis]
MDAFNRWAHTMTLLGPPLDAGRWIAPRSRRHGDVSIPSSGSVRRHSAIVAVERQTDSSVLVSWSDPTHCRYDEQRWISAKARARGRCALTGHEIRHGDAIYKPQWRGAKRPANCREMVLASAVDQFVSRPVRA